MKKKNAKLEKKVSYYKQEIKNLQEQNNRQKQLPKIEQARTIELENEIKFLKYKFIDLSRKLVEISRNVKRPKEYFFNERFELMDSDLSMDFSPKEFLSKRRRSDEKVGVFW